MTHTPRTIWMREKMLPTLTDSASTDVGCTQVTHLRHSAMVAVPSTGRLTNRRGVRRDDRLSYHTLGLCLSMATCHFHTTNETRSCDGSLCYNKCGICGMSGARRVPPPGLRSAPFLMRVSTGRRSPRGQIRCSVNNGYAVSVP